MEPGDEELLRAIVSATIDAELAEMLEGVETGPGLHCGRIILNWDDAPALPFSDYYRPN